MTLKYENQKLRQGYSYIIACDEVGRGCLAGPVVAAAVVFNFQTRPKWFSEIKDSKQLLPEKREYLAKLIKLQSMWSIGEVSAEVVDKINIHNASLLAMKKAVDGLINIGQARGLQSPEKQAEGLPYRQGFLFVDGKFTIPNLDIHQQAIIAGDSKVLSIAAASIIAKVYRDRLMAKLHKTFPIYNFAQHKGYATEHHRKMVIRHGLSPIHRLSFCQNLSI